MQYTLPGMFAQSFSPCFADEDCFVMQEMEKVGPQRHYSVVYFNADAELSTIPDTIFFQQLHAALHPSHKRNLKVCTIS